MTDEHETEVLTQDEFDEWKSRYDHLLMETGLDQSEAGRIALEAVLEKRSE